MTIRAKRTVPVEIPKLNEKTEKALRKLFEEKGLPLGDGSDIIPVINDIGEGLMLSLMNDDDIGMTMVEIFDMIFMLEARVAELEAKLEGGV